jgi:hypothetical protein
VPRTDGCAKVTQPGGPPGRQYAATEVTVARKSPQRPDADKPEAGAPDVETVETGVDTDVDVADTDVNTDPADEAADASASDPDPGDEEREEPADVDRSLWTDTRIDPIEIALPGSVGYTLRAYRPSTALSPTDVEGREEDDDPFAVAEPDVDDDEVVILDEEFAALAAEDDEDDEDEDAKKTDTASGADGKDAKDKAGEDAAEPDKAEEHEDEEGAAGEEVPFFLSHRGRVLIFKSAESLVSFVRSGAPHDLTELDTWDDLVSRIQPADVTAADADSYELDLVVENLRGGYDTWDLDLLIRAGEISRDLGYALRLPAVMAALSPGSPLDDLDEALRAAAGGGIGGFMGRRRLRRIGAQQASLGWRTIIGKISAAVDWRD